MKAATVTPSKSPTKSPRKVRSAPKPCSNWKKSSKLCSKHMMKKDFVFKMFDSKFNKYLQKVLQNIEFKLSLDSDCSERNRAKFAMCFMKDTLEFMLKKTNEIVSHNNSKEAGTKKEKCIFLDLVNWAAIHVGSLQTSLSPSCFISTFRELGLRVMNHQKYCDTTKDIVVTDASNHVNSSSLNWCSSYDKTHELGSYEEIAFKASKDVFLFQITLLLLWMMT